MSSSVSPPLPDNWERTTLGDAFSWSSGGTPLSTKSNYYGGDIPWTIIGDLNDDVVVETQRTISKAGLANSSAKWVEEGSVLIAMYGSIGKLGIAGRRMTTNQAIAFTKPVCCSPQFLFWYLYSSRSALGSLGKGGTQSNISQTVLKTFPFVIPPETEQQRIVAEIEKQFTRLDAGIASLRRARANLTRYRAAVLKAACEGQLVPTEKNLSWQEKRSFETGAQLLARTLQARRTDNVGRARYGEPTTASFADAAKVPEGWTVCSIDQVTESLDAKRSPINKTERARRLGEIPYFGANGQVGWIDDFIFDEPLVLVVEDETFTGRTQPFSYIIRGKTWVNNHAHVLRASGAVSTEFLNYSLSFYPFIPLTTGSTGRKKLTKQALMRAPFLLPPMSEQKRIVAEVDRRLSVVEEMEEAIVTNLQRAARLRQSILQKAFTGQLV